MRRACWGAGLLALAMMCGCGAATEDAAQPPSAQSVAAISIQEVTPTPEQARELEGLKTAAASIDKFKDPDAYRRANEDALEFALSVYADPHPALEDIRMEIAFGEFLLGQTGVALQRLEDALPVYVAAGDDFRDTRIEINNNLGVAYAQMGQPEKAIGFLDSAIADWRVKHDGQPDLDLATAIDNLAMTQSLLGRHDRALDLNLEALAMLEALPEDAESRRGDQIVVATGNRSKYLGESGRLADGLANSMALVSRLDALIGPDHPRGAYVLSSLSSTLANLGQFRSAEDAARRAVALRETHYGADAAETALARNVLVISLLSQSAYKEALPLARNSYEVLNEARGPEAEQTLVARQNLSRALFGLGQSDEALALQARNIAILSESGSLQGYDGEDTYDVYADMLVRSGRPRDAGAAVADYLENSGIGPDSARYHLFVMLQDLAGAQLDPDAKATEGVASSEAWMDRRLADELFSTGNTGLKQASLRASYGRALAAAFTREDPASAFRLMQTYNVSAIGQAQAKQRLLQALPGKRNRERLARWQDLQEERAGLLRASYRAAARGQMPEVRSISEQLRTIDGEIASVAAALRDRIDPGNILDRPSLETVQGGLGPDEALLMMSDTPYGLHILLLDQDSVHLRTQDIGEAGRVFAEASDRLRRPAATPGDFGAFDALGDLIFGDDLTEALSGVTTLAVVSRGVSATVPVSVARMPSGDDRRWVVERMAVHHPATLKDIKDRNSVGARRPERFVGVGFASPSSDDRDDPVASGPSGPLGFRSAQDAETLRALPRLPYAQAELRAIGDRLAPESIDILAEGAFSERDVRALDMEDADIVVFATHGLMAGELEDVPEAALVIAADGNMDTPADDGLLTASEIAAMDLTADWVILSACNSASGDGETGEALSGLATAFTQAGTRSLLVSHWRVRDDAAAYLTVTTLERHQAGQDKAAALQSAMNSLRKSRTISGAADPSIWGPFVLIGQ